jgi:ABC-type glycerol-3-phosphate transport system substrate-binding protein
MSLTKSQLVIVAAVGAIVLILTLILIGILPGLQTTTNNPQAIKANLKFWGVYDANGIYDDIIANFRAAYPGVTITYRGFSDKEDYQSALLDALASGSGPDVFMVQNSELLKNLNKIVPISPLKFSVTNLRQSFPQVAEQDLSYKGNIYALPLYIDTLALIYNRDLFNKAAITVPPATWNDFQSDVKSLTRLDKDKNILEAGAAIGGSEKNINHASDLLSLLMMQTGTKMMSPDLKSTSFYSTSGVNAVRFYTQFADPLNESYAWNNGMPNALDAFSAGKAAMIFDYASALPVISQKNNFINLVVASVPQPKDAAKFTAYPNYWAYAVSKQSKNQDTAWTFIQSMTTNPVNTKSYLAKSGRPPASLTLINSYLDDPSLSVFARQALYAQSWPQIEPDNVSRIFSQMIESINMKQATVESALSQTGDEISQILSQYSF